MAEATEVENCEVPTTAEEPTEHTEDYQKLIDYGLNEKVAIQLDEIYKQGKLKHVDLDERALDALKEFPVDGAVAVLKQFLESNLAHVSNKSAYLCGVMKTYRQRKQFSTNCIENMDSVPVNPGKGPNEENLREILDKSGYSLDVTTGQRKYGGPPPNWDGPPPGPGCEVFCGKIPKDLYEDELIPLFEKCGEVWDLRLMMDPLTGQNRGYAFVTFTSREAANEAVKQLDSYVIRESASLKVNISIPNLRLFVGNIPKSKSKDEILEEFGKKAAGLMEVIIYNSPDDKKKNRGFCFLEYESHKAASLAKRRLSSGRLKVWGCEIIVDWADPQEEPDEDTMSKVKVLYVRNLTQATTEEMLKEKFEEHGRVERVKKIKDYSFIHFEERDDALKAMDALQRKDLGGAAMEISLAKPPSDKKKKEEILRNREKRLMQIMPIPQVGAIRGARTGGRGGRGGEYDYDYEYYGYPDYPGGFDLYYDDLYQYHEDYYYDYSHQPVGGGRSRSRGFPGGRGFGATGRGRGVGSYPRGGSGNMFSGGFRGGVTPMAGRMNRNMRGGVSRGSERGSNLAGKRQLEGGRQNEGDSKRRLQSALPSTSSGDLQGESDGADWVLQPTQEEQWYQDSFANTWS